MFVTTPWLFFVAFVLDCSAPCTAVGSCAARHSRCRSQFAPIVPHSASRCSSRPRADPQRHHRLGLDVPTIAIGDHFSVSTHPRAIERGDIITFDSPWDHEREYVKRVIARGGDTVEVRCGIAYVNGAAVPATAIGGACTYQDRNETTGVWSTLQCSRYHESIADHEYDVFGDVARPTRERDPARTEGDPRDFPTRLRPFEPSCTRSNQQFPPSRSIVETKRVATACEPQLHYVVPDGTYFVMGDNRNNSSDSRVFGPVAKELVTGRVLSIWLAEDKDGYVWSRIRRLE